MRISDWSSDVCSSDLRGPHRPRSRHRPADRAAPRGRRQPLAPPLPARPCGHRGPVHGAVAGRLRVLDPVHRALPHDRADPAHELHAADPAAERRRRPRLGAAGELLHLRFGGHALMNATQSNLPAYLPEGLQIPTPESDSLSAPYWNGLKESVLMVERCKACSGCQWGTEWIGHGCRSFAMGWEKVGGGRRHSRWWRLWNRVD